MGLELLGVSEVRASAVPLGNGTVKCAHGEILTITDLGADNWSGGGDDKQLFAKEYTSGKTTWAAYDSSTEPKILTLGNKLRFAFTPVHGTGGKGADKTEGNFLDSAEFGVGVVTAKRSAFGTKKLQSLPVDENRRECHYVGMKNDNVGIIDETVAKPENIIVLKIEKGDKFAVLINQEGKHVTAKGKAVVLTDTLEQGSRWVIRNPLKTDLDPGDGWFSLESASDPGRFLRHHSLFLCAHKYVELTPVEAALFLSDASWKFVDAQ